MPLDLGWIIPPAFLVLQLADSRLWDFSASITAWVNFYYKFPHIYILLVLFLWRVLTPHHPCTLPGGPVSVGTQSAFPSIIYNGSIQCISSVPASPISFLITCCLLTRPMPHVLGLCYDSAAYEAPTSALVKETLEAIPEKPPNTAALK